MAVEMKVPAFGESITEALVSRWLKREGDPVGPDEPVVVLETDKVTSEVPAPVAGVLRQILVQEGETVPIGTRLAWLDEGAVAAEPAASAVNLGGAPDSVPAAAGGPRVMPAAQRLLHEAGLAASAVTPTGPGGRILKEDVEKTAKTHPSSASPQGGPPAPPAKSPPLPGLLPKVAVPDSVRHEERVPLSPLRKKVAAHLVEAQALAALLTTFNEIDMSAVGDFRKRFKEPFEKKFGIRLGMMSFFVKAAVEALKLVPAVNAQIQGDDILYRHFYDIGVAVGGGRGLVVPVVRDADRMSFAEIEKTIADFSTRAKDGRLTLEELQGGTFTISNGGVYGSMLSTPIVNFPQSGILGLHAIQERPVARDGQVVIRPMMYIALTYDHRLIDGREAVTFLKRIKECIEDPARVLLEI